MPDFTFGAPGLLIEAWRAATPEALPYAGVLVEFDPGIPKTDRGLVLESAFRFWQRNLGMVRRGGRGDLAGWRVYIFKEGRIARIRLSYLEDEDGSAPERAGHPGVPGGDGRTGDDLGPDGR